MLNVPIKFRGQDRIRSSKPFYLCQLCVAKSKSDNIKQFIIKRQCRDRHFFASCQHKGSCIYCAEQHMIKQVEKNEYPTCIIDKNCKSKMITNENSLFQYFSPKGRRIWQQFIQNPQRRRLLASLPKCKQDSCPGVIQKNRCLKCCMYYCQVCGQFDHKASQCYSKRSRSNSFCCF